MTDEAKTRAAADSPASGENRYTDRYDLYRWFKALEDARDGATGFVGSAELEELWRGWFEATTRSQDKPTGPENDFVGSMAPLWKEMAEDLSAEMLSGESLPEDPLRFFLRWYNATSERWSEDADELLRKEEILESASRFFKTYARSYGGLRRASEESLKSLSIPTRSDVARVARLVVVVENKVDRIEEAFEEFIHGDSEPATAEAVGSLEERMDRLEGKMDRILAVLEKLGEAGGGLDPLETSRGSTTEKASDKSITPLEGLSLGLIEAGGIGAGGRGAVEQPKKKEES